MENEATNTINTEPVDARMGEATLKQALRVWIEPEIERRRAEGTLPENFELLGAQVIMNVGEKTRVRLNGEVRGAMVTRLKKPSATEKGEPVYWDQIEDVDEIQLAEEDANAGHLTIVRADTRWLIAFNFRYNAQRAETVISAAKEFLDTAVHANEHGRERAFRENLFGAVELIAKSRLLLNPDPDVLKARTHQGVSSKIHQEARLGNVDRSFVALLKKLEGYRPTARYVAGDVEHDRGVNDAMIALARETLEAVEQMIPKRVSLADG